MGVIIELTLCESGFFDHIHRAIYTENGDIVVAMLKGEVTVKRLFIRDEKTELRPQNPEGRPIPAGPDHGLRILGKVVAVRRPGLNTQTPGTAEQQETRRKEQMAM